MAKITINGITVDPQTQETALASANLISPDAAGSNYILIQTEHPLTKQQKEELASSKAEILEYAPDNTYICRYEPTDLQALRNLPYVTWANIYLEGFKVSPALESLPAEGTPGAHNLLAMASRPVRTLNTTLKTVDVVLHRDVGLSAPLREKIARAAGLDPDGINLSGKKTRITVPVDRLPEIAAIDEVRHIEPVVPYTLHNDVARRILRLDPSPAAGGTAPYEGNGQTVAVADTGFDKGSTTNVHPAFTGRVAKLYALGRAKSNDPNGHGTHVAGSVLGDGASAPLGITIRGTAPQARLILQSLLDANGGLGGLPADLGDLFQAPYSDGARVHTNSWGSINGDSTYNPNSFEVDQFVWEHRDCVVCFSAGNEGTDSDGDGVINPKSITPPGTAKNCITVGATENDRPTFTLKYEQAWPNDFPTEPIASDQVADDPEGMVAFSSRGPTVDQRIKPDVVAPGSFILSARSRDTTSGGWGTTADSLYFFNGGTSMAAPLVAGCAAVTREYLAREHQLASPAAALVKALLINGARNIAGQYVPTEAGALPNNAEGFGRVDMAAILRPAAPGQSILLRDEGTALDTNEEEATTATVPPGAVSLKVTLVWTDPAGEALQNDLDLIVRAGGTERHGNAAPASMAFDRVNNVEQVVWDAPPAGNIEVVVRAHRITLHPQTYALVIRTA